MKILIIQQKMIGDVLTSSMLFEVLKKENPDAELHYLINTHTYPVVENNPFIDKFILFTPEIRKSTLKLFQFTQLIKKENYDVIIDVYCKLSSNLITLFSGSKIKISHKKWYSKWIYTHPIRRLSAPNTNLSLALNNRLKLLTPILKQLPNEVKPNIYLTKKEIENSKRFLEQHGINLSKKLIMISALGSSPSKTYPLEYMAHIIDNIALKIKAQILFNYMPNQEKEVHYIYKCCAEETKKQISINAYGKSLREFIGIIKHCDAIVGNEGGAINIAKALGIPSFKIFSPNIIKHSWVNKEEYAQSVHLSDYCNYNLKEAKKNPVLYYSKLKPKLFKDKLNLFIEQLN